MIPSPSFRGAARLARVRPYPMAAVRQTIADARAAGTDLIDLAVGALDGPVPAPVQAALAAAAAGPDAGAYGASGGGPAFRQAAARRWARRHGVALDPQTQIHAVSGVQEGVASLLSALTDPGDAVAVQRPGYPAWRMQPALLGLDAHDLPEDPAALPAALDALAAATPRLRGLVFAAPSSPAGMGMDTPTARALVETARRRGLWLLHDASNIDLHLDGPPPPSILEAPGALDVAVEIATLAKAHALPGLRAGACAGASALVGHLARLKGLLDHGPCVPVQQAAIAAWDLPEAALAPMRAEIRARRDALLEGLRAAGWAPISPAGGMTVWAPVPARVAPSGAAAAERLVREAGVAVLDGAIFGGPGHVRLALSSPVPRLQEAARRIAALA